MKISNDDLHAAIESYCVLLNRSQWLADDRRLMQQRVWRRSIEAASGDLVLRLDHIEDAITWLLQLDESQNRLLPSDVIRQAAKLARQEATRLRRLYAAWEAGEPMLLGAAQESKRMLHIGPMQQAAAEAQRILAMSLLNETDVETMVVRIADEVRQVENHISAAADRVSAAQLMSSWDTADLSDVDAVLDEFHGR